MENAPVILTATMAAADQMFFNRLRQAHFPAERNFLDAHITLFHHLPPMALPEIKARIAALSKDLAPPVAAVTGLINLGSGVAYRVESADLMAIRDDLAEAFHGLLMPQDQARSRLHITVQNKVKSAEARTLLAQLSKGFVERTLAICGISAFHYLGGPWAPVGQWQFRGKSR